MTDKIQSALEMFRSGKNCAQSVLTAYAEELEFDSDSALAVSCGFGGGMGRLQETCGAATGSFMVLGIHNSKKSTDNDSAKEITNAMIQEFNRQFTAIHKTMNCRLLLGINLNTAEGRQMMSERNLGEVVCEQCISDAVMIVESLMSRK